MSGDPNEIVVEFGEMKVTRAQLGMMRAAIQTMPPEAVEAMIEKIVGSTASTLTTALAQSLAPLARDPERFVETTQYDPEIQAAARVIQRRIGDLMVTALRS